MLGFIEPQPLCGVQRWRRSRRRDGRRGSVTRKVRRSRASSCKREAHDLLAARAEIFAVERDGLTEVLDAATDQSLGEIGEPAAGAVGHLQLLPGRALAVKARKFGVGIQLPQLAVDVGLDAAEEVERRLCADHEDRVEGGEAMEEMSAE